MMMALLIDGTIAHLDVRGAQIKLDRRRGAQVEIDTYNGSITTRPMSPQDAEEFVAKIHALMMARQGTNENKIRAFMLRTGLSADEIVIVKTSHGSYPQWRGAGVMEIAKRERCS